MDSEDSGCVNFGVCFSIVHSASVILYLYFTRNEVQYYEKILSL
uniref:Uncharacterized protein n=1 Tax=Arundo donax TaxID=35708 RepID=A0A0A9HP97_ARUDO